MKLQSRGYVILAFNSNGTDYVHCAKILTDSIHRAMPDAKVTLITDNIVVDPRFDKIITIGSSDNDNWKMANDWKVYNLSPYDLTIKLEADMYLPRSVEHWWEILADRELNICTTIRNFRGEVSENKFYRKTFVDSNLPDTYNAITYFKKGEVAEEFYGYVRDIFENWDEYSLLLKYSSESKPTTDVVYGIAALMLGPEQCTMPKFTDFSMTHLKQEINGLSTSTWYDECVYEVQPDSFRINTYVQLYPVHYYNKSFSEIIDQEINLYD